MATILIVDDHPTNREFLVTLLGYKGHRLIEAADGIEGLNQALAEQPDLIITDVLMPVMDGYEFVRRLRAEPALASTPIIFYTAHYQEAEAQTLAQACGIPYLLPKPSKPEVVLKMVEAALGSALPPVPPPPPEAFDREHLRLLTNKLSEKVDELQGVNARLSTLVDINLQLASERDSRRLLERFCHTARELMGAKVATVSVIREGERSLRHFFASGLTGKTSARLDSLLPRTDILAPLLAQRRPYRQHNPGGDPETIGFPPTYPPIHCLLAAPLISPTHVYGWLCLIDKIGAEEFSEEDERLAGILAAQVGRVYENRRLYAEVQRHAKELEQEVAERQRAEEALQDSIQQLGLAYEQATIYARELSAEIAERKQAVEQIRQSATRADALVRMAARLNAQLDLETVLNTVSEEAARALNVPAAAVRLYDEQHEALYYASAFGLGPDYHQYTQPSPRVLYDELFRQQGAFIIASDVQAISNVPNANLYTTLNIRTVVSVSMERERQWIGVLNIFTFGEVRHFSEEELAMLKGLADQAAQAIINARLLDAVQQELAERKRAERALEEERALLAQRVADRTAELSAANAELARTARAKDEFLASMSHELRTPLNAILGLSEVLLEQISGSLNERQLKSLRIIEESGRHLLALINDILDLSKIEAGKLELQLDLVSLEAVCQASLQFIKETALKKKINVSFTMDDTQATMRADVRRLKQILVNLLSNAVKFTPAGGQIGLAVTGEVEQEVIHFTVWDTGIGIATEDLPHLFKRFVQVDSSLSRQHEGTGLGLALVTRLVELHGGSVSVESDGVPGRGSRFTVSLPWLSASETTQKAKLAEMALDLSALEPPLILLAEDNEANIHLLTEYLGGEGYRIVAARNGAEAIDRAGEEPPALILMDIQMPGMDGLEAIHRLRTEAHLAIVPIIAMTGLAMPGDRERCLAAGANDYLSKPVGLKELTKMIEAQLKQVKV